MDELLSALASQSRGNPNVQDISAIKTLVDAMSAPEGVLRQGGLTARHLASGVGGLGAAFANPLAWTMNQALDAGGSDYRFPEQFGALQQAMTQAGLPEPQGALEKGIGFAAEIGVPDPTDSARVVSALSHMVDPNLAMTVFHGSPHKWDRVDLSKVGTGEGAQAYGHGFYAAEAEDVAHEYARTVGSDLRYNDVSQFEDGVISYIESYGADVGRRGLRSDLERSAAGGAFAPYDKDEAARILADYDESFDRIAAQLDLTGDTPKYRGKELEPATGNIYELDLPDETIDKMLDWDAPLSEQPEGVKRAFEKLREQYRSAEGGMDIPYIEDHHTGEQIYREFEQIAHWAGEGDTPSAASARLNELGIPGIKYLDGTSRSAGEGTRNFVIFDEQHITPLTRNGEKLK